MKKTAVFLLLIAASTQVKAQLLLQQSPNLKLNDGLQNTFKPATPLTPRQMLMQQIKVTNNTIIVYSTMPVAKLSSNDKMPLSAPVQNGVKYTMLEQKVEIVNPNEPVKKPSMP